MIVPYSIQQYTFELFDISTEFLKTILDIPKAGSAVGLYVNSVHYCELLDILIPDIYLQVAQIKHHKYKFYMHPSPFSKFHVFFTAEGVEYSGVITKFTNVDAVAIYVKYGLQHIIMMFDLNKTLIEYIHIQDEKLMQKNDKQRFLLLNCVV